MLISSIYLQIRRIISNNHMKISQFGFGTAAIGRPMYINIRNQKATPFNLDKFRADGLTILDQAYKSGIRYFDTAPGYGISEDLLIKWLKSKKDNSIEIATKWGYEYTANFNTKATTHERKEHSLQMLKKQWQHSENLIPHLTTHQIHSATFETGVLNNEEILTELHSLKSDFNLKIGLTTSGENQTEVLSKALENDLFEVFQVTYNVFDQSLRQFLATHDFSNKRLIIKEGLANGRIFRNDKYSHYNKNYDLLENLAYKHKVGVDAIALQFCAQTVGAYTVLSGASHRDQLIQNIESVNLELTKNEINQLEEISIEPKYYWNERKQMAWN